MVARGSGQLRHDRRAGSSGFRMNWKLTPPAAAKFDTRLAGRGATCWIMVASTSVKVGWIGLW